MRQPNQGELFNKYVSSSEKSNISEAYNKVFANIGVVLTRDHLEEQMVTLKNMRKTSYYPLMSQVFQFVAAIFSGTAPRPRHPAAWAKYMFVVVCSWARLIAREIIEWSMILFTYPRIEAMPEIR